MIKELIKWLDDNSICYHVIDNEVIEIEQFGKLFLADLSNVNSIFRGTKDNLSFNLMENPDILMDEGINHVAFPFGKNWYYYDLREEFKFNILKHIGKRKETTRDIGYVNLGIHTGFELLNGSGDISQWIKKAKQMGHKAIGICDYNTMAATLTLQKECAKAGIKHVFGYSFTLEHGESNIEMKVYCQSQQGLKNLLRIQKEIMVDSDKNTLSLEGLLKYAGGNVLVLGKLSSYWIKGNLHILSLLEDTFEKVYYQIDLSEYKAERIDVEVLQSARFFFSNFYNHESNSFIIEPVLICDNYYIDKDEARNKIILNKIAQGSAHKQSEDQYFKDIDEHFLSIAPLFSADMWNIEGLFRLMCENTLHIAANAIAKFDLGKVYMPQYIMLDEERKKYGDRRRMFHALIEEGLKKKVPVRDHERYRKRLEEEIYIIESTNNVDYFLMQYDMVKEARRRGITVGIGRGSAGGSLVSYLLGIISINPITYDLMFSRFLVPERCGLQWVDKITYISEDIELEPGETYVKIDTDNGCLHLNKWALVRIKRSDKEQTIYANDIQEGDEILFDNRDLLWTLKDILQ